VTSIPRARKLFGLGLFVNLVSALLFATLVEWPCRKLIRYK
jgi:hypothetical protein